MPTQTRVDVLTLTHQPCFATGFGEDWYQKKRKQPSPLGGNSEGRTTERGRLYSGYMAASPRSQTRPRSPPEPIFRLSGGRHPHPHGARSAVRPPEVGNRPNIAELGVCLRRVRRVQLG